MFYTNVRKTSHNVSHLIVVPLGSVYLSDLVIRG